MLVIDLSHILLLHEEAFLNKYFHFNHEIHPNSVLPASIDPFTMYFVESANLHYVILTFHKPMLGCSSVA